MHLKQITDFGKKRDTLNGKSRERNQSSAL